YEIEWYFPRAIVSMLWDKTASDGLFENSEAYHKPFYDVLRETGVRGTKSPGNRKVDFARLAVQKARADSVFADSWFQDEMGKKLRGHIQMLADFIRRANGAAK